MTLYIKNMVCNRCIMAVQQIMNEMDIPSTAIRLGEVDLVESISDEKSALLSDKLTAIGFELIDDKKSRLIEKIKTTVIDFVRYSSEQHKTNLSDYLENRCMVLRIIYILRGFLSVRCGAHHTADAYPLR